MINARSKQSAVATIKMLHIRQAGSCFAKTTERKGKTAENHFIIKRRGQFMLKKILLVAFTLLITLFASVGFAASKYDPAIAAAKAEIPAGVELYGIEEKEGKIELNFYDGNTLLSYEVEVIAATNKVKEIEIKGSNLPGSTRITKTEAEIRSIVLGEYPDAQNIRIEVETDGNLRYYEAEFTTPKYKAELKINPHTGAICKRELSYF